jgi:hypothetical protein
MRCIMHEGKWRAKTPLETAVVGRCIIAPSMPSCPLLEYNVRNDASAGSQLWLPCRLGVPRACRIARGCAGAGGPLSNASHLPRSVMTVGAVTRHPLVNLMHAALLPRMQRLDRPSSLPSLSTSASQAEGLRSSCRRRSSSGKVAARHSSVRRRVPPTLWVSEPSNGCRNQVCPLGGIPTGSCKTQCRSVIVVSSCHPPDDVILSGVAGQRHIAVLGVPRDLAVLGARLRRFFSGWLRRCRGFQTKVSRAGSVSCRGGSCHGGIAGDAEVDFWDGPF